MCASVAFARVEERCVQRYSIERIVEFAAPQTATIISAAIAAACAVVAVVSAASAIANLTSPSKCLRRLYSHQPHPCSQAQYASARFPELL